MEPSAGVDADALLDAARTVTLAVASDGTVMAARGGFGGFLDFDIGDTVGTNVFDRLAPEDADELAVYFLENAGESADTIALPIPFRLRVLADDGIEHFVDVIATGHQRSVDDWYWVVVLVPVELTTSMSRSLELEMAGADRGAVKRMLCEEVASDNMLYSSRTMLVEFGTGKSGDGIDVRANTSPGTFSIVTSREQDRDDATIFLDDIRDGWRPWDGTDLGSVASISLDDVPAASRRALERRNWRRFLVAPVHVQGRTRAAILLVSRVPDSYPVDVIKQNVARRLLALCNATAMLIERWDDQDRLHGEATTDALTGLGNARLLSAHLRSTPAESAVLFIDVDHFKEVNDTFGHSAGDRVLVTVADRIVESCRQNDVVTRIGGDEFVVVLSGADRQVASGIGHRILDSVSRPLDIDGGPERVSISIGVSSMLHDDPLEAADLAMLRAKRAGRGRLSVSEKP